MGDEGHDGEVGDRGVDRVAGADRQEASDRDADLLGHLALGRLPGALAGQHAAARERHLPGMVAHIGATPDKWDHPLAGLAVQDENHGGGPGAFPELPPIVHRPEQAFETARELTHLTCVSP